MRQKVTAFSTFWGQVYADFPAIEKGTIVSNFIDSSHAEKAISGIEIYSESTFWSKRGRSLNTLQRWPLPSELRLVTDSAARNYALARLLLQSDLHCIMCLNPSTLLQFCRTIERFSAELIAGLLQGDWGTRDESILTALDVSGSSPLTDYLTVNQQSAERLSQSLMSSGKPQLKLLWPTLELIICWQSGIVQPYFSQLGPYTSDVPMRDYISQSSECVMAIPLQDGFSGGALAYSSHFFEFIPEIHQQQKDPASLFSWQLEPGKRYELVVTTGAGLYRYRTGDCVLVRGFVGSVPIIEFLYRFGKTSSITGEKITEMQVLESAEVATAQTNFQPNEYLCYPCTGETPHYGVLVDANKQNHANADTEASVRAWFSAFEQALMRANSEYRDKFMSGRLGPMALYRVDENALRNARLELKSAQVSEQQVKPEVLTSKLDRHKLIPSAQRLGQPPRPM